MKINKILDLHKKWLNNEEGEVRANLVGVDLSGIDFRCVDFRDADLANLSGF